MKKILAAGSIIELSILPVANIAGITNATFTEIQDALTGLSTDVTERDQIDITSLDETYAKQYMDGLKDADTASSEAFFNLSSPEGKLLTSAANSRKEHALRVTFTDGSVWTSLGRVQPFGFDLKVGDVAKTTFNFKLTGEPSIVVSTEA